jgi:hypothetical protein
VPLSQLSDVFHFYSLTEAVPFAHSGDVITIEPGASPDASVVTITHDGVTIQGDPNVPASILPSYQLNVPANFAHLVNLNLTSVTLGTPSISSPNFGNFIGKSLINNLTENGFNSAFSQNTITGLAHFIHADRDQIVNNVFATNGTLSLLLEFCLQGTLVSQNTFFGHSTGFSGAIQVQNSGTDQAVLGGPVIISNNTIALSGMHAIGITVLASGIDSPFSDVNILNNTISTNITGTGLVLYTDSGGLRALVQGNDLWNNLVGVSITGDSAGNPGDIDMGGGNLGSLGGNDFRAWNSTTDPSTYPAIDLFRTQAKTIMATTNMFDANVIPSQVCRLNGNPINLGGPLSDKGSFVQSLYNKVLGRTGTRAEIDAWVNVLAAQSQAAVANGILRSAESLGRIVDSLYLRFLGRRSDSAGRAAWVHSLQNGATLESIETAFLTSPEYLGHINTDFVQSLYINVLGRTGGANELAFWNNNIQTLGLSGIATGFVGSQEYRTDSINADFQTFLHRPVFPSEISTFAALHTDLLGLEVAILGTPAYLSVA